jgi:integrase/recombinase XerD
MTRRLSSSFLDRWPAVSNCAPAVSWLQMQENLGLAEGTLTVYARSLDSYLSACAEAGINALQANQGDVARWIHQLSGLSNATLQLRLVAVRLFYEHLVEEGLRPRNPVGRGRRRGTDQGPPERGLLPKLHKQPWIPNDKDWLAVLAAAKTEPIRNRLMIGLAYDAGLRREELCALRTDDIDSAHRTVRVPTWLGRGGSFTRLPPSPAIGIRQRPCSTSTSPAAIWPLA